MDCVLYIDLFFLWNFWMNTIVLFAVRQITKTYRTMRCLLAALSGACFACLLLVWYITSGRTGWILVGEFGVVVFMNLLAFGRKNLVWHLFLFTVTGAVAAGILLYLNSVLGISKNTVAVVLVSAICCLLCIVLERQTRIRWKEEHMKAKTVLEFGDRKVFATALIDTGNKLYDPIFHKPVILVDEKMMQEMLTYCKEECPEKYHFIPFHSVGKENGLLEGITFDCVSIKWENKQMKFREVIAAATKESLYKGKEYQIIFHCGLLQEG